MAHQGEPSSHLVEQPRQGIKCEEIPVNPSSLMGIFQAKYEQLGRLVYPMWSTMWNKQKTSLPSSSTGLLDILKEPEGTLEEKYKEFKERLAKAHAQLKEKDEECEHIRHTCGGQVKALNSKMEELMQKDVERENFLKEQAHNLSEDFHKRLADVEHKCEEQLEQVQKKINEHRLAMSNLYEEVQESLTKVSQAISTYT
eukprot:c11438_g1_i1 orf=182-778(-)